MKARKLYTKDEDRKIRDYVKANKFQFCVAGNELWKKLQRSNQIPGRTWQSLRDRYLKYLKNKPQKTLKRLRQQRGNDGESTSGSSNDESRSEDTNQTDDHKDPEILEISTTDEEYKGMPQIKEKNVTLLSLINPLGTDLFEDGFTLTWIKSSNNFHI